VWYSVGGGWWKMSEKIIEKSKRAVELARKNGRILDVSEAFIRYPVENEWHKGKIENWKQGEGVK